MCDGVRMETEKGEVDYGLVSDKKEIKSEVENTLILDCFLNAFSCAQIGQSSFNAKANKSIYTKPICFSFSNRPFFTIFPSSMHSSSVNLLCLSNSSSLASIKSLASLNFTNSSTPLAKSDMSTLNRSGILTTTSAISITANNVGNGYIKHFLSEERTCAKKGNLLTLTSCEDARYKMQVKPVSCIRHKKEKQNMPPAKQFGQTFLKFDTWFESTRGLRIEGKREEVKKRKEMCAVIGDKVSDA